MAVKTKRDPMKTRNGRINLKPFNITQLMSLFESTSRKKEKAKIQKRISVLIARNK